MNRSEALQYLKEQGADVGMLKTGSDAEIIQIAEGIKRLMEAVPMQKVQTFWKVGDKVANRWDAENVGTIIAVSVSAESYYPNGVSHQKVKPRYPIEWCMIKFQDGEIREQAGHELLVIERVR